MLNEVPYKIIKIHGYLHPWHKHFNKMNKVIGLAKEKELPIMLHTGGMKECYAFKYKKICKSNPENIFIFAHSRPVQRTINVMSSCPNVYCDIAFTPINKIRLLIESRLEDRMLSVTDYPIINSFETENDINVLYKERRKEIKSIMSKTTFNKITKTNFISLFNY
jgi:hypothetical protein